LTLNQIRLIHWNSEESKERAKRLECLDYKVIYNIPGGPDLLRDLRNDPPDAVVIDLSRLPSQGRDIALAIRHQKTTRHLPLIFVEGETEKVKRIQEYLPDATYTTWDRIDRALKRAIAHPPKDPIVPKSRMAGYSGAPLVKKLGIKENSTVVLINAPQYFEKLLDKLPEGVRLKGKNSGFRDITLWFVKLTKELDGYIDKIAKKVGKGSLWIVWPKKSSGVSSDLTQNRVRKVGLASGLVDYKICSFDETWSGLLFSRRKSK
jgi:CheY-like chemotaxis protein